MAELPHIGLQCEKCKRLDFLPVTCVHCGKPFCKEHLSFEVHQCAQFAQSDKFIDDDVVAEKRIHEKCTFCCSVVKNRLEMVQCEHCQARFCLNHRHPEGHKCQSVASLGDKKTISAHELIAAASGSPKTGSIPGNQSTAQVGPKGAKNDALAKKVALMKLKQTAVGSQSIPQSERIYFSLDLGNKSPVKSIFLSSAWSIGKAIDFISDQFKLVNNNNKPGQPKLVIATESSPLTPYDQTWLSLIRSGSIEMGQKLFMKYI